MKGLVIAAMHSSSGKSVVTAGIIKALRHENYRPAAVKIGPDYIDPQLLSLAAEAPCLNIDLWAMEQDYAVNLVQEHVSSQGADIVIAEAVMGLFDGARCLDEVIKGSSADVASLFGWNVVLVIDACAFGESIAASIRGFRDFRSDVNIVGVIFNRISSESHIELLTRVMARHHGDLALLGFIPSDDSFVYGSRHLGLMQACENEVEVREKLVRSSELVARHVDLVGVVGCASGVLGSVGSVGFPFVLGSSPRHVAIAYDVAFSFVYRHFVMGLEGLGIEVTFFSPLADESLPVGADVVFLPGGYPELYAERLSCVGNFRSSVGSAVGDGVVIYGECGGYMVMGESIIDFGGCEHSMLGLLPLRTSFSPVRRSFGYRGVRLLGDCFLGCVGDYFGAHEFHHADVVECLYGGGVVGMWDVEDSVGLGLGEGGQVLGSVCGSFMHVIARRNKTFEKKEKSRTQCKARKG